MAIITTTAIVVSSRARQQRPDVVPVQRRTLASLLNDLGVDEIKTHKSDKIAALRSTKTIFHFKKTGGSKVENQWHIYEYARSKRLALIKQLHPDNNKNTKETNTKCAELNAIWTRIKELFARHGIGDD